MSEAARNWGDLITRIFTAVFLIAIGGGALVVGGGVLLAAIALACGLMVWELARMLAPDQPNAAWVLGASAVVAMLSPLVNIPVALGAVLVIGLGIVWLKQGKYTFALYSLVIFAGCFSIFFTRSFYWPQAYWLVGVVVVTDVAGYVFGRFLGGPKFWPRISPKKTWSGTIGGWIGAAIVGFGFSPDLGVWIVLGSVMFSFVSQMGDIAESAIKRRAGVKDSSNLLPGHGGLLDRFDGMIAVFALWFVFVVAAGMMSAGMMPGGY